MTHQGLKILRVNLGLLQKQGPSDVDFLQETGSLLLQVTEMMSVQTKMASVTKCKTLIEQLARSTYFWDLKHGVKYLAACNMLYIELCKQAKVTLPTNIYNSSETSNQVKIA